jgi:hypothetical protein
MKPIENRKVLGWKLLSPDRNDESVLKAKLTPILKAKDLGKIFSSFEESISGGISLVELLETVEEVLYWASKVLSSNADIRLDPYINSEKIVGDTGPDGVVESREIKRKAILVESSPFKSIMEKILLTILSVKKNRHLSAPLLQNEVESTIIGAFSDVSTLKDRILKRFREDEARETRVPKETILPPSIGFEHIIRKKKALATSNTNSKNTSNAIRSFVDKYGLSVIPESVKTQIAKSSSTKSKKKIVRKRQNSQYNRSRKSVKRRRRN